MQNPITWLTAEPGRKRAIATTAAIASVALRHLNAMFRELCAQGFEVACGWRLDQFSDYALQVNVYIDALTVGSDITAFFMGIPALIHAYRRKRAEAEFFAPPKDFYKYEP